MESAWMRYRAAQKDAIPCGRKDRFGLDCSTNDNTVESNQEEP